MSNTKSNSTAAVQILGAFTSGLVRGLSTQLRTMANIVSIAEVAVEEGTSALTRITKLDQNPRVVEFNQGYQDGTEILEMYLDATNPHEILKYVRRDNTADAL